MMKDLTCEPLIDFKTLRKNCPFFSDDDFEQFLDNSVFLNFFQKVHKNASWVKQAKKIEDTKNLSANQCIATLFKSIILEKKFTSIDAVQMKFKVKDVYDEIFNKDVLKSLSCFDENTILEIFYTAMTIKIVAWIRENKVSNLSEITQNDATQDFQKLVKSYQKKQDSLSSQYTTDFDDILAPHRGLGKKSANIYTQKLRLVVEPLFKKSHSTVWNDDVLLIGLTRSCLRALYGKQAFTLEYLRGHISRNHVVSQFYPTVVMDSFINLFRFNKEFRDLFVRIKTMNVADFCGGWGDRLVGYLAMGDIIGKMTISDPNPELQSCYESIVNLHAPLKKSSIKLLSQPAEKLEAKDIGDLHFSIHGLPFWLKENYQGGQQSSQYRYLSDWLNQFYIPFIRLCLSTHVPNGVFIVNIGNIKFGKEFAIEKDFKAKEIDLVSSSEKIIQQFGTFARLIAKKSYPVLNMNNKRLNQSNTSVLFVVQRNSNPLININEIKYQSDVSTTKTSQVQKYSHQKRKKEEISLPTEIIGDEKRTLDDGKRTIPTPPSVGVVSLGTESSALATGVPNIPEGLKYVKVPGDGHCLYYAIGHYVNKDQKTLRALVADRLEKQDADLSKFILLRADQSIEEYIKDIRNEKEWAGHVEIQVLMKIFERPIVIIGPNGGIKNQGQYLDFADKDPIFVYYNGHTHYDALLVEKNNGKSILKKLESAVTSSRTVSTSQLFSSSSTSSLSALSSQKEVIQPKL